MCCITLEITFEILMTVCVSFLTRSGLTESRESRGSSMSPWSDNMSLWRLTERISRNRKKLVYNSNYRPRGHFRFLTEGHLVETTLPTMFGYKAIWFCLLKVLLKPVYTTTLIKSDKKCTLITLIYSQIWPFNCFFPSKLPGNWGR